MKKFTLSILAVLATALVMTSCIDNAVSKEVKDLRAAQVAKVQAQTALTNAQAAYQTALAAVENANAAYINAEADNLEVETQRDLVLLEREQAAAEVYLAQQELALQQAIDAMAEYIATHALTLAGDYLESYQAASGAAKELAGDIADQNVLIAELVLYFISGDEADGGEYIDNLRKIRQRALDEAELDLANAEAALETILAVEADPSDAQAEWADVKSQIQDITNQVLALNIDLVPLDQDLGDANDALNDASEAYDDNQAVIDEYEDAEGAVADAEDAVAEALADANAETADDQEQLAPFLDALVDAYANNADFVAQIATIEQQTRVAINAWKVANAQGNALAAGGGAISDAPGYDEAQTAVEDAIAAIEDLTGNDLGDYDVSDETTYPGYTAAVTGDYTLTVNPVTTGALVAGDKYSQGGVQYTVKANTAGGSGGFDITGKGTPTAGTLTKVTSAAGDATITVTVVMTNIAYVQNDENGMLLEGEIEDLADQLIDNDLSQAGADPDTEYYQAGVLYDPVSNFFDGGSASTLVNSIGRYNSGSFLTNFTEADGVVADMDENGNGGPGEVWYDYWNALSDLGYAEDDLEDLDEDAYDDAVAAEPGLSTALDAADAAQEAAQDAYDVIGDEISDLNTQKCRLIQVLGAIEDFIDGANADIDVFKDNVEDAQSAVDQADKALQMLDADEVHIDEQIAYEQAYLADLQAQLAAKQAEAAAWLALLNGVLGN